MNRILHVTGAMNRAGAETMIMNIYRNIDRSKCQFDFLIFTEEHQDYEDEIVKLGGKIIRIKHRRGIKSIMEIISLLKKTEIQYTAIHCATLLGSIYPLIASIFFPKILRVCHSHTTRSSLNKSSIRKLYELFAKTIIRQLTQVQVACGIEAGRYLFGNRFETKGLILNNSIDTNIHFPYKDGSDGSKEVNKLRQQFAIQHEIVIGNVARFTDVKNHEFMIQIAKELLGKKVKFKMILVGMGELYPKIKSLIEDNALQEYVILPGVQENTAKFFNLFDIFILPSRYEGNPVTLIEAQACGVPCIISENITDKMDMGINLIEKASIENLYQWVDLICKKNKERVTDIQKISDALKNNGYDIKYTSEMLLNKYLNR